MVGDFKAKKTTETIGPVPSADGGPQVHAGVLDKRAWGSVRTVHPLKATRTYSEKLSHNLMSILLSFQAPEIRDVC